LKLALIGLAALLAASTLPAVAMDSMMAAGNKSMMMKPGEVMMMMPTGETMMVPAMSGPMDPGMMKAATVMDDCVMMMMGKDHKMYMVHDMKMANGKMACAAMTSMMKK